MLFPKDSLIADDMHTTSAVMASKVLFLFPWIAKYFTIVLHNPV